MTDYQHYSDETKLANYDESELDEIKALQEEYDEMMNRQWKMIPADEIEERLLKLKTMNEHWLKLFSVYKEPIDLRLMINDYLDTVSKKMDEKPTVPWLLVHLNLNKKQMKEILEIWDAFSQVMSMGLLKIESILLNMGLNKKLDNKILSLALKNYHWLSEKLSDDKPSDESLKISFIIKPNIVWDVDDRIIEVE